MEMTLKNTKAEILEALNAALERFQEMDKGKLNPEKFERTQLEGRAVQSVKSSINEGIFSTRIIDKWNDLQMAIEVEERKLEELYGVGKELQNLALVIEVGKEQMQEIDQDKEKQTEEIKVNLEKLRTEYMSKKLELLDDYEATNRKIKQDRVREEEEYKYNLSRARAIESNEFEDEKRAREAELFRKETRIADLLSEVNFKAEHVKNLEAEVEGFAERIENEKALAVKAAIMQVSLEYDHKIALSVKDYESAIERLKDKIAYMDKELDLLANANKILQAKVDNSYMEMRDLVAKSVSQVV